MPTNNCVVAVLWLAVAVVSIVAVLAKPMPVPPETIPDDAASIGPDGYMRAWRDGNRIKMKFRNIPQVTICFDCRAAGDFAEWLQRNGDVVGEPIFSPKVSE